MSGRKGLDGMLDTALSLSRRDVNLNVAVSSPEPLASTIIGVILSFGASSVLSCFLTHRFLAVKDWWRLPFISWLVVAIYIDSWIFVFGTAIIDYGIGVDSNLGVCSAAILLCLFCYISTKYEIALIVDDRDLTLTSRLRSLFIYSWLKKRRVARMEDDQCIIGIKRQALIPLIVFDILVNIYLTVLFLNPLQNIYLGKGLTRWPPNPPKLRAAGIRTFIGALCTTTSSVVNLTVLMVLDGELGWVCLMCCNADILFSALVIQWLTARDNSAGGGAISSSNNGTIIPSSSGASASDKAPALHPASSAAGTAPSRPRRRRGHRPTISLPMHATSTSQYEHIFGGDPEPEQLETDVASTSASNSDTAAAAAKSSSAPGAATAAAKNNTLSYFSFDDSDLTPAANDDEIDIGAGAVVTTKSANKRSPFANADDNNGTPLPTATTGARPPSVDPLTPSPRIGRARHRYESGVPTTPASASASASSSSAAAAAAVAADLERIRLYRQRRPTPSRAAARAAAAVAEEAAAGAYPYRISHVAFEGDRGSSRGGGGGGGGGGGELPWYEFGGGALDRDRDGDESGGDVGEGESQGPAGWI
ncbi:hypothetical protein Hte_003358 [Hypoxylon texense]